MKEIKKFTLQVLLESHPTHSLLLCEDKPTGLELNGISLDGQYQYKNKYILLITHDSPYADTLYIYMTNENHQKVDEWVISPSRESEWFMLRNLETVGENQIRFSFHGNDLWNLTVLEKPQRTLPRFPLFSSYWKPLRFALTRGYLHIEKNIGPPCSGMSTGSVAGMSPG